MNDSDPAGRRLLLAASAGLVVAVALHGADHVLQERGVGALTTEVRLGGAATWAAAVTAFVLALRDHRWAPQIGAFLGGYIALGVTAAHFAPHWSAFSDPYAELDLGVASWAAAALEVLAGATLCAAGIAVARRRRASARLAIG
jgi:hypothetical protein